MESEARHQTGGHLTKGFCWRVGWGGGGVAIRNAHD